MTLGVVMLVHTAFDRAAQIARHWVQSGCPVVIHVDKQVSKTDYDWLVAEFADSADVRFSKRHRCIWGMWGIVAATQSATEVMLREFADVRHVYLASGSCMPLRPVSELVEYLEARPRTDFIESATTEDVPWTVGGLDEERFTLRFPVSWKRHRRLFDGYVRLQRRIGFRRRIPAGLVPHMGSQWWCLTRQTLSAILEDPDRSKYDAYFRRVWIPDESYFQTMARLYSTNIESRSLTLAKFDFQGKPHIFYDDHLQLLRRSDCFVARKIWPHAERLYAEFLGDGGPPDNRAEPNPSKIDRIFTKATERRVHGRAGLFMQSRFPKYAWDNGLTASPYSVFEGFTELFENFEDWLGNATGIKVHGHLYAPDRAEFYGKHTEFSGVLPDSAALRDYNPLSFLTNLIWNARGERQCFQFGPADTQKIGWDIASDHNAQVSVITGAWAVRLFQSNENFSEIRKHAAQYQKAESEHISILKAPTTKAKVRIWTLAEFIENPMEPLQTIVDEIGVKARRRLAEAPHMRDLDGFGQFLQNLKNQGMHPHLVGDFPMGNDPRPRRQQRRKPYLVK